MHIFHSCGTDTLFPYKGMLCGYGITSGNFYIVWGTKQSYLRMPGSSWAGNVMLLPRSADLAQLGKSKPFSSRRNHAGSPELAKLWVQRATDECVCARGRAVCAGQERQDHEVLSEAGRGIVQGSGSLSVPCFRSAGSARSLRSPLVAALAQRHVLVTGTISRVRLAHALPSQHKKRGPSGAQRVNIPISDTA